MWKMSNVSHVKSVTSVTCVTCDTVRLLLFLVYHFECNRSSVHHFGCIYPPFGAPPPHQRPSLGMQGFVQKEHVCQRQVRTNQSIIMEGCLVARTCASAHFWFRYHSRLKRFILQRGVHSNIIPESELLSTIQNCSLEHLWNSHCPIDI